MSRGRERVPIRVVNEVDGEALPADFTYVTGLTDTKHAQFPRQMDGIQVHF